MSKIWTPNGKSEAKPKKLESFLNYYGNQGSSIKSGCSFFVQEDVKFKPSQDIIQMMNYNVLVNQT